MLTPVCVSDTIIHTNTKQKAHNTHMSSINTDPDHLVNDQRVFITPTGAMYKQRLERITNAEAIIQSLGASVPVTVPNIGAIDYNINGDGNEAERAPVKLVIAQGKYFASTRLRKLAVNTAWIANESGELVPTFQAGRDTLPLAPVFNMPDALDVRIGVCLQLDNLDRDNPVYRWESTLLFCRLVGQPGDYMLPLPNVYADGKMCMGSGYRLSVPSICRALDEVVERVRVSPWNSDLLTAVDRRSANAQRMFRLNLDGSPLPITDTDLRSLLTPVSHPHMAHV